MFSLWHLLLREQYIWPDADDFGHIPKYYFVFQKKKSLRYYFNRKNISKNRVFCWGRRDVKFLEKTVLLSRQYQYNALYLHTASSIVVWSARNSSLVEWQAYAVFGVPGVVYMVHLLEALFSKCRFYSKIFHLNDRYLFHFICHPILSLTFKKSSLLFRVAVKV